MPEFILDHGNRESAFKFKSLDSFTQGYIEAMFFTSTGTGDDEDLRDADLSQLAPSAWQSIIEDCAEFQADNAKLLDCAIQVGYNHSDKRHEYDMEAAGRDFWYTRQGHGVGYWDRGLGEYGDELSAKCEDYGEYDLYRGDDGLIYLT